MSVNEQDQAHMKIEEHEVALLGFPKEVFMPFSLHVIYRDNDLCILRDPRER